MHARMKTVMDTASRRLGMKRRIKIMKIEEIRQAIKQLAQSQGFYGRLDRTLTEIETEDTARYTQIVAEFEAQNFKDVVDLVLYLEG